MDLLYILIPISICLGAFGLVGFFWALKTDQYFDYEKDIESSMNFKKESEKP